MTFTVSLDHAKINKEAKEAVEARIESEKNRIIGKIVNELFSNPNHFNPTGGAMYSLLKERIENMALDAMANLDMDKLRKDFDRQFNKFYLEHLPVASERAAKKVAYQVADKLAHEKVKKQ